MVGPIQLASTLRGHFTVVANKWYGTQSRLAQSLYAWKEISHPSAWLVCSQILIYCVFLSSFVSLRSEFVIKIDSGIICRDQTKFFRLFSESIFFLANLKRGKVNSSFLFLAFELSDSAEMSSLRVICSTKVDTLKLMGCFVQTSNLF